MHACDLHATPTTTTTPAPPLPPDPLLHTSISWLTMHPHAWAVSGTARRCMPCQPPTGHTGHSSNHGGAACTTCTWLSPCASITLQPLNSALIALSSLSSLLGLKHCCSCRRTRSASTALPRSALLSRHPPAMVWLALCRAALAACCLASRCTHTGAATDQRPGQGRAGHVRLQSLHIWLTPPVWVGCLPLQPRPV
jgi:hypothetical protein